MVKFFTLIVMMTAMPYMAYADAIEDIESRGISRSDIEKARMVIYENPQYKALQAAGYYCDLLETRKDLDRAIKSEKKVKGRSGSPSFSRLEELDNLFRLNSDEIKQQISLYKMAFNKGLTSSVCKNKGKLSERLDALHDRLLLEAFKAK